MGKEVKCTHIVSQLKNIKKYEGYTFRTSKGEVFIEVYDSKEGLAIYGMETHMNAALLYYKDLIELTSK